MENNFLSNFKRNFFFIKKYFLVYLICLIILSLSFFQIKNYTNPKFEIIVLLLLTIMGFFCLVFSVKYKKDIHKIALVIILIFGILMVFINPVLITCDEGEHFARSDITASGIIIPNFIENKGYVCSDLVIQVNNHAGETLSFSKLNSMDINNTNVFYDAAFSQNPFYGYIFSALGILLAKLLDLSAIFAIWFGRLFNLIVYSCICAFAIKKAPVYKMPLLVVSCIPLVIYQAASFSVDGLIYCFAILAIAYFIKMYNAEFIDKKDIIIFFVSILWISLYKIPYSLLGILIFFISRDKFKSDNLYYISRIIPFLIILFSAFFSLFGLSQLKYSRRAIHFANDNVSVQGQLNFIINNPLNSIILLGNLPHFIYEMVRDLFRFSYVSWTFDSPFLGIFYFLFFSFFSVIYPIKLNFKKNKRILLFLIVFLIFMGIIFIVYLSWAPVGYPNLDMIVGVYARYLIPLLLLFPLIFSLSEDKVQLNIKNIELKTILFVLIFLSALVILLTSKFY